ncbi:MAG TPA: ATP-dependent Clp protease adaptor ClpS [Bryobacterales bacterium]|jgi:ATP-dependent Clp protease adaptor protein ClpS|nr:ATP-dependent Clp protease adaptor ClpS [Bryobacterales bacterium]
MATVALPEIDDEILDRLEPLYNLILLDDDDHTYDYVVEMLVKIFGFSETVAFRHAVEVDTEGRTLLLTAPLEEVQAKREQIHAYGADWRLERSKGSMSAIIEPAGPSEK